MAGTIMKILKVLSAALQKQKEDRMKEIRENARKLMKGFCRADGGVRDGVDVFKMISLGADCILIGRPFCIAAVGGLKQGVIRYLETVKEQFTQAMVITGSSGVSFIDDTVCSRPGSMG